jgi:hypoxanthine phosphoribosyltransferase
MADLVRHLDIPVHCEFVKVSSYGGRITTSGRIKFLLNIRRSVKGRDVIIIEDIVDTGLTARHLLRKIKSQKPRSVRLCALLDKPSRRRVPVQVDYFGFSIPDRFIVGYGIDYNENYRSLPDIRYIDPRVQ